MFYTECDSLPHRQGSLHIVPGDEAAAVAVQLIEGQPEVLLLLQRGQAHGGRHELSVVYGACTSRPLGHRCDPRPSMAAGQSSRDSHARSQSDKKR